MHSVSCRPVSVARNRHVHFHHEGRSYPYLAAVKSERRQQLLRAHWRRYVRPRDFAFVCSANFKCSVVSCSPHHYNNNARVPPTWLTTADQTKADRGERGERIEGGREDGDEAAVDAVQDKVMVVDVVVDVAVDVMYIISVVVMGINRVVDSKEVVAMGIRVVLVVLVLGIKVVVSCYDSNIDQNINRSQATIPHRRQRCRRRRGRSLGLRHCSSPRSATTSTSATSALRAFIPGLPIACGADNPRATAILDFRDCEEDCGFCGKPGHPGEPCHTIYCSEKWWAEHHGKAPANVQLRPSEQQRERLAAMDPFFRNFPSVILPMSKGPQGSHQVPHHQAPHGVKRGFDEVQDEVEVAKNKAAEQMLKRQRDKAMNEVLEMKGKMLVAEQEALEAKKLYLEYKDAADKKQRQVDQLRQMRAERDAKIEQRDAQIQAFDQEISSREDAASRREEAKYRSLLETLQKEWRAETKRQVEEAVQRIKVEASITVVDHEAAAIAKNDATKGEAIIAEKAALDSNTSVEDADEAKEEPPLAPSTPPARPKSP
jgi:hypothetical protein